MKIFETLLLASAVFLFRGDAGGAERCETLLLVGDSLSVGVQPHLRRLVESSGGRLVFAGMIGTNTCQWRGLVWPLVVQHKPSTVIIMLGTNDAVVPDWSRNHADCYGDLINETLGAKATWVLPPPMKWDIERNIKDVRKNVISVTKFVYDGSVDVDLQRSADGVHMTGSGYERWANRIFLWIKKGSS